MGSVDGAEGGASVDPASGEGVAFAFRITGALARIAIGWAAGFALVRANAVPLPNAERE